jgi:hypothetical protein
MPISATPIGVQEIDPELSASTGLTNDVCGRLAIFDAKNTKAHAEIPVSLSEQVTPSKVSKLLPCIGYQNFKRARRSHLFCDLVLQRVPA